MRAPRTISEQFEFKFEIQPDRPDPVLAWRESRRRDVENLCQRLGLPLGHQAEVRLLNGKVLRGILKLVDTKFWDKTDRELVLLEIDGTEFRFPEIISVVRVHKTDLFE